MAEDEQKSDPADRKPVNNYMKFTGVGFQMIGIIGVFAFIGYKIDTSAAHQVKWVTAALSLAGVFISLYVVIRSLKE